KHIRFGVFFIFFFLLFLFYPGDNPILKLVAYEREVFNEQTNEPAIVIKPIPVPNLPAPFITAQGLYVVELDTFTPVLKKNEHLKFFPASTAKIITALVSYDEFGQNDIVTVNQATTEGQIMELIPNERITVENLLYGILVHSGNDAAFALANHMGYANFIAKMNLKAQLLSMKNSYFTNPAGLDDQRQVTSPYDLALAARALLQNQYLRKMVGTKEIIISDVDYKIFHRLTNINKLLGEIQGIGGLKTGYTELAGENLVSFYRHNGHDYIIVILKSEDRFEDTASVVNWIDTAITYVTPEL
ncbi:MAG: hypothetical protein COU81_01950, partial [Candidatus Portnoybacteria bacterium CG10_big_fil_rev_8_21_14_0_10_36_7]